MLSVLQSSLRGGWWSGGDGGEGGEGGEEGEGERGLETCAVDCDLRTAEVTLADEIRGLGVAVDGRPSSPSSVTVLIENFTSHVHVYTYMYSSMYMYVYIYTCTCTCKFTRAPTGTCTCTCRSIHVYVYMYLQ